MGPENIAVMTRPMVETFPRRGSGIKSSDAELLQPGGGRRHSSGRWHSQEQFRIDRRCRALLPFFVASSGRRFRVLDKSLAAASRADGFVCKHLPGFVGGRRCLPGWGETFSSTTISEAPLSSFLISAGIGVKAACARRTIPAEGTLYPYPCEGLPRPSPRVRIRKNALRFSSRVWLLACGEVLGSRALDGVNGDVSDKNAKETAGIKWGGKKP